jgi:hypothetical protein
VRAHVPKRALEQAWHLIIDNVHILLFAKMFKIEAYNHRDSVKAAGRADSRRGGTSESKRREEK